MALTGRTALLAALGSLPVGIWEPSWTGILAVNTPWPWPAPATSPWPPRYADCA